MRRKTFVSLCAAAAMCLAVASSPSAQQNNDRLQITAFAINMSNIATGTNATVDITVDSWSTPEERELLITTMLEKGQDDLLKALQRQPVRGRFRLPGKMGPDPHQLALGHDIRYSRQNPLPDGGRQIVLVTDRYIGFQEARNQSRTMDYPFTLMEIRVDKEGKGQGKMAVATKISFDAAKKTIELENYGSEPVRLNEVRVKVKT